MAFFVEALVAGANPDHAIIFVIKNFTRGKLGKDVDPGLFTFFPEPFTHLAKAEYVFTLVLQRWRNERSVDPFSVGQIPKGILRYHRINRTALFQEVRHQLANSDRIHHSTTKNMRSDERALLDDTDLDLADRASRLQPSFDEVVMLRNLLLQPKSTRKIRRPGADEDNIHLDLFAFDHKLLLYDSLFQLSRQAFTGTFVLRFLRG